MTFIFRLVLGLIFLVFGASKLPDLAAFTSIVEGYRVLPVELARVYASVLPWAEVAIGALLIAGLGLRFVAAAAILVIASFITATAANLYWLYSGVKICGCLAGMAWPLGPDHLVVQVLMLIMAAQISLHRGELWSLDGKLFGKR